MTAQWYSSSLGPLPLIHVGGLLSAYLLSSKAVVWPCLSSCLLQRSGNWQLSPINFSWASDLWQPLAMLQETWTFFQNFMQVELMATSPGVRVSSTFLWVTAWIWPIATLGNIIPTDLYHKVSIMIYGVPWGVHSQPVIRFGGSLNWTWREIDELRIQLFRAVAGYWLDGWSTVPTADAASIGASIGPLVTLTIRCTAGGQSHFLHLIPRVSANNSCPTGVPAAWMSNTGRNQRWSADPSCWAVHRCQGSGALKFWSCDRNQWFTHWACGTSNGLGSTREKPWKKPHWDGLTHLREDLLEGGVHLLGHPELLVLIILGQPFQFEGQSQFKLIFGLGNFL